MRKISGSITVFDRTADSADRNAIDNAQASADNAQNTASAARTATEQLQVSVEGVLEQTVDGVRIGRGCQLYAEGGTLDMGEDAALSPGVTVDASGGLIRIGKQVAIGPGTVLRAANHCFDSLEKPIMLQGHLYGEIVIEDDVWIAANCTITPGTRIGHGAVVGAGAVVTRDVEPYAIVGGVPARVIGSRRKD